jgi:hypothetical protein
MGAAADKYPLHFDAPVTANSLNAEKSKEIEKFQDTYMVEVILTWVII